LLSIINIERLFLMGLIIFGHKNEQKVILIEHTNAGMAYIVDYVRDKVNIQICLFILFCNNKTTEHQVFASFILIVFCI
jgi:hypothetical protein